jgi:hypothetical protein|tara:strand:- start:499 stop:966 length:468 start_codon:yes stop_codon:yes gene_type:complete
MKFFIKFLFIFILTTNSSYAESFFKKLFDSGNKLIPEGVKVDKSDFNVVCAISSLGDKQYQNQAYSHSMNFNNGHMVGTNITYFEMDDMEFDTEITLNYVTKNYAYVNWERTNGDKTNLEWQLNRTTAILTSWLNDGNNVIREDKFLCKKSENKI